MSLSESMFLLEIIVEELKSYTDRKEFYIQCHFTDIFVINLRDPNVFDTVFIKPKLKKLKKNIKLRKKIAQKIASEGKVQKGQSIIFTSKIDELIKTMKNFPIEILLFNKDDPENKLGSTQVPWSPAVIDYLYKIKSKSNTCPVCVTGDYNIYDDYTSKRMAKIRLNFKLTHLKDKIASTFCPLSKENQNTGFNSKPVTIIMTPKEPSTNLTQEIGLIKTIYGGRNRNIKRSNKSKSIKNKTKKATLVENTMYTKLAEQITKEKLEQTCSLQSSRLSFFKSDTNLLHNAKGLDIVKSKSCSSVNQEQSNIFDRIFACENGPADNQVYCVGYCTVENEFKTDRDSSKASSVKNPTPSSDNSDTSKNRYKFRICDEECLGKKNDDTTCSESMCSLDLPEKAGELIKVTKCKQGDCDNKIHRELPPPPDDRILLNLQNKECCHKTETVEQVVGGVNAKMKIGDTDCYCSCECTFGFVKKTTYCGTCGGYEITGEDITTKNPAASFPCPVYHKLVDKNKLKTLSTSGSDSRRKGKDRQRKKSVPDKSAGDRNTESEMDSKKGKKNKDDRFKFNYGYTAAKIGHTHCGMSCTSSLGVVPKSMGWLWTAEDVPGMKFRPNWKPGATHKHVVRLLRMAKNPGEVFTKKKKRDTGKPKKPLKRPLLVVQKKDGEYTVTMETMKVYSKPRALNQHPYEDKPVLTYTIGRTEEENRERQRKKERARRRLEREQREYIQSAFKDMCEEICLKTYQQALGILPDAEDPDCACYPKHPGADKTNLDISCSCSEDSRSLASDTDSDEWLVEFTPPNATFDPTYKGKKVLKTENGTQYTYLDYRVKLLDRYGSPVPRFFKGHDGQQQCSDLGGFWSPDHKWLEINIDGYIAPDCRWAPLSFFGPNGEQIECDNGKFQAANGRWLVVGVDGYIDCSNKWRFYRKPRGTVSPVKKRRVDVGKKGTGDKKGDISKAPYNPSEATWSCFGDANPKDLSKMGILGHGQDKKLLLSTLKNMLARGEDVRIPQPSMVPRISHANKGRRQKADVNVYDSRTYFLNRQKCRHPVPSDKGIMAVDEQGNKTYFRLKEYKNKRPKERLANLTKQGISLSSFHQPCFSSFVSTELMKKQQLERLMALSQMNANNSTDHKCVSTQAGTKSRIVQ